MAGPAAGPGLPGFGEIAVAMLPFALSRSPWFGLGARWCPGRSGAAIYQTVSGGACCATTTSHDFAVTGAATGISPGPGPIPQGLSSGKAASFLGILNDERNYDSAPATAPTATARSAWYSG